MKLLLEAPRKSSNLLFWRTRVTLAQSTPVPPTSKASGKSFLRAALHVESRFIVNKDAKAQILVQHIPDVD